MTVEDLRKSPISIKLTDNDLSFIKEHLPQTDKYTELFEDIKDLVTTSRDVEITFRRRPFETTKKFNRASLIISWTVIEDGTRFKYYDNHKINLLNI